MSYLITVMPVDEAVANRAGEMGAELHDRGTNLATPDLLIAATALLHDLAVVSNNAQHFARVPDLHLLNWLQP